MKVYTLECDNCGASLKIKPKQKSVKCEYCDSVLQISKDVFMEMNAMDDILKENEKKEQDAQRDAEGEKVFKSHKRIWNAVLIFGVVVICAAFLAEDSEVYKDLARSFWPALLIFGGSALAAGKPRKDIYMGFKDEGRQKKFYDWITLWRTLLFIWAAAMSVLWGVPTDHAYHDPMFDVGFALLIAGLVFFIRYRPTKFRSLQK